MYGDEARVIDAFCASLEADGWQVAREVEFVDVVAHKDGTTIYAEAKGRTSSPGLDVDTMYGQLLRRMGDDPRPRARYAVVVPDVALSAAERVPAWLRSRLGIDVYAVYEDGRVELHQATALSAPGNSRPVLVEDSEDERRRSWHAEGSAPTGRRSTASASTPCSPWPSGRPAQVSRGSAETPATTWTLGSRQMADRAFRDAHWENRYEPRVAVVNRFVDELRVGGRDVPYVGSHYDVRVARVLTLFSNPGPRAGGDQGSGFISFCNDDPSAQRLLETVRAAGLSETDTVPWNIHPWHVHDQQGGGLRSAQVTEGVPALARVLELVPTIRFVVLHGLDARTGWQRLTRTRPRIAQRYRVWETFHTSNRAFTGCSAEARNDRLVRLTQTYREVAAALSDVR